jgi:subtilase family serine protease
MRRTLTFAILLLAVTTASACTASPEALEAASTPLAKTFTSSPAHMTTLTTALRSMRQHYRDFGNQTPGAEDILHYGVGDLWAKGIDGTGTTIALIEGWNDPRIDASMSKLDRQFGLPAPDIRTIYPTGAGHLPAQCPQAMVALGEYGSCDAWAGEVQLDAEAAHIMAPYAKIFIVVAPADSEITDDDASQVAPPEMMQAVEYVSTHHLADVISISDNTGESTYSHGKPEITAQDPGELTAAADGIPLLVGTGDCGAVQNLATASGQCTNTTAKPDTATWDDSPWVTAVGGSVPDVNTSTGARQGPDQVWQEGNLAEGAGYSSVYPRPDYQRGVSANPMRSVPDITMDAALGTSESTPMFAGVLALAAQLNHGAVGPVNNALYQVLGPRGSKAGITDVATGSNTVTAMPGFPARAGFDTATGWGTIDAGTFVPALVAAIRTNSPRAQAAAALTQLQHAVRLTGTASPQLSASGFLPGHPVALSIDGQHVTTLTANTEGAVSYKITSTTPGQHTLTLTSMLLTKTTKFGSHL